MDHRLVGAMLVIAGCGGIGLSMAAGHRGTIRWLRDLRAILDFMEAELNYRLTPLPKLCREAAAREGKLKTLLTLLADELDSQVSPEAELCMKSALAKCPQIPAAVQNCLVNLGECFGIFDLHGQLQGIASVRCACERTLSELENNKDARIRGYQTLGFCIGAALVIVLI